MAETVHDKRKRRAAQSRDRIVARGMDPERFRRLQQLGELLVRCPHPSETVTVVETPCLFDQDDVS